MSTVLDIRKQIKSGKTGPLYLLEGDDLQSRHDLALEFAAVVDEGLQAFNVQSFYANEAGNAGARDALIGALLSNARTRPIGCWRPSAPRTTKTAIPSRRRKASAPPRRRRPRSSRPTSRSRSR
jgi:hypothetical protein